MSPSDLFRSSRVPSLRSDPASGLQPAPLAPAEAQAPDGRGLGGWANGLREGLLSAMTRVDALPPLAAGTLVLGAEDPRSGGMILVERNRVCWAIAAGMRQRLRDILRSHCLKPLDDGELDHMFERCRDEGVPLGEALEKQGLVSARELRAALKEQTVESLLALGTAIDPRGGPAWPLRWVDRPDRGYNPRFTFTTAEIVAAVGARLVDATAAAIVADHLEGLASTGSAAVAFIAGEGGAAPLFVGLQSTFSLTVGDVLDLATWSAAALQASAGFSAVATHALAQSAPGAAVAWQIDRFGCAAVCPSRQSLQRLVNALSNQGLAMVLATRLSVLERLRERTAISGE